MTADKLTPGLRLRGEIVRERGGEFVPLPAVVKDCRREDHDGVVEVHVWWTCGGDCWYPMTADLEVLW